MVSRSFLFIFYSIHDVLHCSGFPHHILDREEQSLQTLYNQTQSEHKALVINSYLLC